MAKMSQKERTAYITALDQILHQAGQLDGHLSQVTLIMRYAPKVGAHVHATGTVKHRLHATVNVGDELERG